MVDLGVRGPSVRKRRAIPTKKISWPVRFTGFLHIPNEL
uniref:Uncharacterized protein n=1 Tax=Triticum urartu TaxID=4572 RepID=A0A8R7R7Z4_TRIUA